MALTYRTPPPPPLAAARYAYDHIGVYVSSDGPDVSGVGIGVDWTGYVHPFAAIGGHPRVLRHLAHLTGGLHVPPRWIADCVSTATGVMLSQRCDLVRDATGVAATLRAIMAHVKMWGPVSSMPATVQTALAHRADQTRFPSFSNGFRGNHGATRVRNETRARVIQLSFHDIGEDESAGTPADVSATRAMLTYEYAVMTRGTTGAPTSYAVVTDTKALRSHCLSVASRYLTTTAAARTAALAPGHAALSGWDEELAKMSAHVDTARDASSAVAAQLDNCVHEWDGAFTTDFVREVEETLANPATRVLHMTALLSAVAGEGTQLLRRFCAFADFVELPVVLDALLDPQLLPLRVYGPAGFVPITPRRGTFPAAILPMVRMPQPRLSASAAANSGATTSDLRADVRAAVEPQDMLSERTSYLSRAHMRLSAYETQLHPLRSWELERFARKAERAVNPLPVPAIYTSTSALAAAAAMTPAAAMAPATTTTAPMGGAAAWLVSPATTPVAPSLPLPPQVLPLTTAYVPTHPVDVQASQMLALLTSNSALGKRKRDADDAFVLAKARCEELDELLADNRAQLAAHAVRLASYAPAALPAVAPPPAAQGSGGGWSP